MNAEPKSKPKCACLRSCLYYLIAALFGLVMLYLVAGRDAIEKSRENGAMQVARDLGLDFFAYAQDHDGNYPDGKSSTEVFQKLIDGGYLADDNGTTLDYSSLYYPIPGKMPAPVGTKILKPENVCWDVTVPISTGAPDELPVVYLTGRKVSYIPGDRAVLIPHPPRTWWDWWEGKQYPDKFIVVNFLGNSSDVFNAAPDGSIQDFIPSDINLGDVKYRQLGPDGPVAP